MRIRVKVITGKVLPLDVSATAMVRALKIELKHQIEVPIEEMQLIFNRKELKDTQTLASANVREGSDVFLVLLLTSGFDVFVRTLTNKTMVISVLSRYSIREVKQRIKDHEGIPEDHQILLFKNKQLDDKETIRSCNIGREDALSLILKTSSSDESMKSPLMDVSSRHDLEMDFGRSRPRTSQPMQHSKRNPTLARLPTIKEEEYKSFHQTPVKFYVELFTGEKISVDEAQLDTTVSTLKALLARKPCLAPTAFKLYFGGKEMVQGNDSLRTYIPLNNLKQSVKVICKSDRVTCENSKGEKFQISLYEGISVAQITTRIATEKSLPEKAITLVLAKRTLSKAEELLDMLTTTSVLHVRVKLSLLVRDLGGRLLRVDMQDSDSVQQLQTIVSEKSRVELKRCELKLKNGPLQADKLALVPGMKPGLMVHLQCLFKIA